MKNGLIIKNENKYFYLNDKLHRDDGPAIEFSFGTKKWYQDGRLHRLDGPAIENCAICEEANSHHWYYDNEYIECNSQEEFEQLLKLRAFL